LRSDNGSKSLSGVRNRVYVANKLNNVYGDKCGGGAWENTIGRFPANLIHDNSPEVLAGFPQTTSGLKNSGQYSKGAFTAQGVDGTACLNDSGSVARFFYTPKASGRERLNNPHPTVNPLAVDQIPLPIGSTTTAQPHP
jgi:hypothetical protein